MTIQANKREEFSRLSWLCRRGMLELDLLLAQYLERQFEEMDAEGQALFEQLLSCTDQDLYAWLLKNQPASNPQFEPLLQKIREYVPCN